MFMTLILVVHVIVCIALILIILLQSGKGADIGAVFGGGSSQTLFGSSGATPFLSKVTIGAAVVFMITSIILTYFSGKGAVAIDKSIVSGTPAATAPMTHEQPPTGAEPGKSGGTPQAPAGAPAPQSSDAKPSGDTAPTPAAPSPAQSAPGGAAEKTTPKE